MGSTQLWNLLPDGYLRSQFNGLVVEAIEGYHEQDEELHVWAKTGSSLQKWCLGPGAEFQYLENSWGMVLEAQHEDGGVSLCSMPKSSRREQLWRLTPDGHIQCRSNFLMLCVRKGSRIQGAKLSFGSTSQRRAISKTRSQGWCWISRVVATRKALKSGSGPRTAPWGRDGSRDHLKRHVTAHAKNGVPLSNPLHATWQQLIMMGFLWPEDFPSMHELALSKHVVQ